MNQKIYMLLVTALFFSGRPLAQDSITVDDAREIKFKAKRLINTDYSDLLNSISNINSTASDVNDMILISYSKNPKQVFLSQTTVIENDINPHFHNSSNTADMKVEEYLRELVLQYHKTDDQSIVFTDINTSNVKKGKALYLKVYFSSFFKNGSKFDTTYTPNNRVAEIFVEKENNKWTPHIAGIRFYNPEDTLNDNATDIQLIRPKSSLASSAVADSASTAAHDKTLEETLARDRQDRQIEEDRKETEQYRDFISKGEKSESESDLTGALNYYKKASDLKPYDPYAKSKINSVNKKIVNSDRLDDQLYTDFIRKAVLAEKKREYENAFAFYASAWEKKPEEKAKFDAHLRELREKSDAIYRLDQKYKLGRYKEAIDDYNAIIKKNKKATDPREVSDYYTGRGKCYDKLNEYDKALKDYSQACLDNDNLEALKLRADLYKRHNNFIDAVTDYNSYLRDAKDDIDAWQEIADLRLKLDRTKLDEAIKDMSNGLSSNPKATQLYFKRGLYLVQKNDFKNANTNFSNVIELDPDNALAYYQHGKCQLELKHVDNAAKDFDEARQKGLDSTDARNIQTFAVEFFKSAQIKSNNGEKDSAIKMIDYAIAIDPGNSTYHFTRGDYYYTLRNYNEAIASCDRAIKLNEKYADAYYKRGLSHYYLADYKTAVIDFNGALISDPQYYLAQKSRGDSYFAMKDYVNSELNFERCIQTAGAMKVGPDAAFLALVYNSMGRSEFLSDHYPQAIATLTKAIKKNSSLAEAYFNRGIAYYKTGGELSNAISDYKQALTLENMHHAWHYYLAKAYQEKKDFQNAIDSYRNCINQDSLSEMKDALYLRGYCKLQLQNYFDALADYNKCRDTHQDSVAGFDYDLGNIYFNLDKYDSALFYYNIAYIKDSTNAHTMYGIASSFFLSMKVDDAMRWYEKAFQTKMITKSDIKKDKIYAKLNEDPKFKSLFKRYF